jgi:hypothetical protein
MAVAVDGERRRTPIDLAELSGLLENLDYVYPIGDVVSSQHDIPATVGLWQTEGAYASNEGPVVPAPLR